MFNQLLLLFLNYARYKRGDAYEFLTFGGYRYDYSHPEIPHYNLIEVNEIDSLPNGSGPKVFERLANNVADDIKEVLLCHLNSRKLENERV